MTLSFVRWRRDCNLWRHFVHLPLTLDSQTLVAYLEWMLVAAS